MKLTPPFLPQREYVVKLKLRLPTLALENLLPPPPLPQPRPTLSQLSLVPLSNLGMLPPLCLPSSESKLAQLLPPPNLLLGESAGYIIPEIG
jgi:hypothetical protein